MVFNDSSIPKAQQDKREGKNRSSHKSKKLKGTNRLNKSSFVEATVIGLLSPVAKASEIKFYYLGIKR